MLRCSHLLEAGADIFRFSAPALCALRAGCRRLSRCFPAARLDGAGVAGTFGRQHNDDLSDAVTGVHLTLRVGPRQNPLMLSRSFDRIEAKRRTTTGGSLGGESKANQSTELAKFLENGGTLREQERHRRQTTAGQFLQLERVFSCRASREYRKSRNLEFCDPQHEMARSCRLWSFASGARPCDAFIFRTAFERG